MVLPEQTGELLPTVGAPGAEGSLNVNGPTDEDVQPVSVTVTFV